MTHGRNRKSLPGCRRKKSMVNELHYSATQQIIYLDLTKKNQKEFLHVCKYNKEFNYSRLPLDEFDNTGLVKFINACQENEAFNHTIFEGLIFYSDYLLKRDQVIIKPKLSNSFFSLFSNGPSLNELVRDRIPKPYKNENALTALANLLTYIDKKVRICLKEIFMYRISKTVSATS